ncbi:MAG: lipopolysaccharide biosynthesis protein [Planctomycetota bacterium]|jgi:O-antigen/teichoic acid export membrane protein
MTNLSFAPRIILKEGAWSAFGKITTALGTLIGVRLLTEFVPKEIYGKISLLIGIATLGSNLFAYPLISAAQRFHPEMALSGNVSQFRRTIVGILKWTVGTLASLILLGGLFVQSSALSYWVFVALAAFLVVQVMRNLEMGFLIAARRQKEVAIWSISEAWLKPAFAVLLVILLGDTPQSVLLGYFAAFGSILLCFHLLPVSVEGSNNSKVKIETDTELLANIRRYAMPLVPLALVVWISSLSDRYIISGMLGVGQVGLYAAGYGLISMPFLMAGDIIGQTLRPPYYQAVSAGNITLGKKLLRTQLSITVLVCSAGVVAVFFLRNLIASLLLAEEYRSAVSLMPWIASGITLQIITQIFEGILIAYKRTGFLLMVHSLGAVVCVLSVYILIRRFNLIGAAMACPVYYLCMLIIGIVLATIALKDPKTITI